MTTKGLLWSRTLHGVMVMLLGPWLVQHGFDEGTVQEIAEALVVLVGAAWAIYGRIRADTTIKGMVAPPS